MDRIVILCRQYNINYKIIQKVGFSRTCKDKLTLKESLLCHLIKLLITAIRQLSALVLLPARIDSTCLVVSIGVFWFIKLFKN